MKFRVAMSKSSSLHCRPKKHHKFFPTLINTVSCTAIFPMVYIVFQRTFLKHVINTDLFSHETRYILAFSLILFFYNSALIRNAKEEIIDKVL